MLCCTTALVGEDFVRLDSLPIRTRVSGEDVVLNGHEHMGLAGLHEEFFVSDEVPGLYVGMGGYGAVTGERGGFFVLGGSLGWTSPTWHGLGLDLGGFVGGGGEAADAGQGGGLMLRGHALASYAVPGGALQAGVASTDFPTGDISGTGFTAGLVLNDALTVASLTNVAQPGGVLDRQRWGFAPLLMRYRLDSGLAGRNGQDPGETLDLAGFEFSRSVSGEWSIPVVFGGAFRSGKAGYMEVLGGLAYGIGDLWRANVRALVGLGGGGEIDTGGGVLLRPELAVGRRLAHDWTLEARGGRFWAPDGDFHGWMGALALRWDPEQWHVLADGGGTAATIPASAAHLDAWRMSIANTTYRFRTGDHVDVQLIDFSLEKPLNSWCAVVGRTRSAYEGDAGGYSEGLFGLRGEWPALPWLRLAVEADAGAGGGGALPTGGGLIVGLAGDLRCRIYKPLELRIGGGRITGLDGELSADVVTIGLAWEFARALVR